MDLSMSPTRSMVWSSLIGFSPHSRTGSGFQTQTPAGGRGLRSSTTASERRTALAGGDAQAQGVELDEARGIGLVVGAGIVLEGSDVGVEQRLVGLATGDDHVALVQLQAYHAVHRGLGGVDHLLQHQALRAPPVAVVD